MHMQLHLRRTQREGGLVSKSVIFCLDARVQFTTEEQQSITRYKLANQVIYNSEASQRMLARADANNDGSTVGHLKGIAFAAMAAMKLNITINSLQQGQHIECKTLDELIGAEDAVVDACKNLRAYLDTAATFNGSEVVIDFSTPEPATVAAASPQDRLVTSSDQPITRSLASPQSQPDTLSSGGF
jgi:hypothetical protein